MCSLILYLLVLSERDIALRVEWVLLFYRMCSLILYLLVLSERDIALLVELGLLPRLLQPF